MDDITPATRRMTYAELGKARGISPKSAERLAQRHRWLRQIGNDGMARVAVPIGEDRITPRRQGRRHPPTLGDVGGPTTSSSAPDIGDVVRASIRDVVAPLSAQLGHERARADRAEEKAAALRAELVDLQMAELGAGAEAVMALLIADNRLYGKIGGSEGRHQQPAQPHHLCRISAFWKGGRGKRYTSF